MKLGVELPSAWLLHGSAYGRSCKVPWHVPSRQERSPRCLYVVLSHRGEYFGCTAQQQGSVTSSSIAMAKPTVDAISPACVRIALGGLHVGAGRNMPGTLVSGAASAGQQQLPQRQQRSVEARTASDEDLAAGQEETMCGRRVPASSRARVAMRARNAMLSMRTRIPSAQGFM